MKNVGLSVLSIFNVSVLMQLNLVNSRLFDCFMTLIVYALKCFYSQDGPLE